jgi:hypothetical protein
MAQEINQFNIEYTASTSELIVDAYAAHEGIPAQELYDTLDCESGMRANAIGDQGTSYGVAQIHLASHSGITKAQALDPFFAIGWAAHQFKLGHQREWTCWRDIHASEGG